MRSIDAASYNRVDPGTSHIGLAVATKPGWLFVTDYKPADVPFLQSLPGAQFLKDRILVPLNAAMALPDRFAVTYDPQRLTDVPAATERGLAEIPSRIGPDIFPNAEVDTEFVLFRRQGAAHLRQPVGAVLADETGVGKCAQALLAAHVSNFKRVLVIAPLGARSVWCGPYSDAKRRFGLTILPLSKTKGVGNVGPSLADVPNEDRPHGRLWIFCHYDILANWFAYLVSGLRPECVIVDEAHKMFGHKTTRAKRCTAICRLNTVRSRYILTATQVRKSRTNMYPLLDCAQPGAFGSFFDYARAYAGAVKGEYAWHYGEDAFEYAEANGEDPDEILGIRDDEFKERLKFLLLRRTRAEVQGDLPPLTRELVDVEISSAAREDYERVERNVIQYLRDTKGDVQIEGGEHLLKITTLCALLSTAKVPGTVGIIRDALAETDKVVVFTWYKESAVAIIEALRAEVASDVEIYGPVSGEMSATKREAAAAGFRERVGQAVFVATLGASSESINDLVGACVGITHDLYWDPTPLIQGEGRLSRTGQTRPVTWFYPHVPDTVEDQIIGKLLRAASEIEKASGGTLASSIAGLLTGGAVAAEDPLQALVNDLLALEAEAA